MSIATIKASNRRYRVTPATAQQVGFPFLEIGPAGTSGRTAVHMMQFSPSGGFDGQFVVEGRLLGNAADEVDVPFQPIPYRRITLANTAQDYAIVTDILTTAATIMIPASGLSIALQMSAATTGFCDIVMWDLQGSSGIG
jgi:hypothetical protein